MSILTSTPRQDGFHMPAEWAPHSQTWLIWPERTDNWREGAKPVQLAHATLAKAIAEFEPVTVGVSAAQYENARARLDHPNIRVVEISNDDAWVRDTGPTFVINNEGEVRGVDWDFNAWGGLNGGLYFPWKRDQQVAGKILEIERCQRYALPGFVLEGGSIHVDGEGTVIVTEECLLNTNRNPHLDRAEIEEVLKQHLNIDKVIWLPTGLFNDETNGHVDNFCCYIRPAEVLLAWTDNEQDPNYALCRSALDVLQQKKDARGRAFVVHTIPIPGPLYATEEEVASVDLVEGSQERTTESRLAGSYVNFLFVNGGIIAPCFDDPRDEEARAVLERICPDHKVVMIPGRELLLGGGNIHCLTQQQPAPVRG